MIYKGRSINGQVVEYQVNAVALPPIPKDWPLWAKAMKCFAEPEDKGIGDVVARLIGDENSEQFKSWYKSTFNKDCNCKGRQDRWNRLYPLE